MNPQIVTVNLIPGLSTPAVVRVSQYDVERPITFRVLDGNKAAVFPDDCTATIEATKPSGLGFSLLGTIAPGGMVSFTTGVAMTQECGMIPTEIRFSTNAYGSFPATDIGTANFILAVEPSPHPEGTTDGTQETMQNLETRLQGQIDALDTRVDALEAGQGGGSGLTDDVKNALLQIAQKVAYIDAHGQDYYDDLYDALYNDTTRSVLLVLSHVSSSNTQSTVEVGDSYTTTLTASTNYTINSVSVTMGGVDITSTAYSSGTVSIPSVNGNIVITATAVLAAQSITATYTQSGTVYDTATLDSLKADLVVTANYSGGTSETIPASDYTLSGTLTEGTSTITVSYAGLTDTFDVTVSTWSTSPRIAQYDANYKADLTIGNATGLCITEPYWFTLDMDALKLTTYYDSTNDYFNTAGVPVKLKILESNTSGASGFQANNKIAYLDESETYFAFNSVTYSTSEANAASGRYDTHFTNLSNDKIGIAFTLVTGDIENCYAYWNLLNNCPAPIGVNNGDIIFAGSNTPYYGMHNISEASS